MAFPRCLFQIMLRRACFASKFARAIPMPMTQPTRTTKDAQAGVARGVLGASAMLAGIAWIGVATASALRKPGWEGILGGLFGGFILALAILAAGAWLAMGLAAGPRVPDTAGGEEIEAALQDVLDELEATRLATINEINVRAFWRVPLCAAAGVALIILSQFSDDPPDFMEMISLVIVPAMGGYVWASMDLSSKYARLYKDRVLPRLASTFGSLNYRRAIAPDLGPLKDEGVFRRFDNVLADDEIYGARRNLPINIVELKLTERSGKNERTTFDGLLVSIDLPRDTGAVTAVISDQGALGNFFDRRSDVSRERVALEDPVFEKVYEVYSTDQVAARALLHPAFMEKMLALGRLPDFERPMVLCSGRRLQIAMPKRSGKSLFEAPSFRKPAASRESLVQLRKDLAAVLAAADAVIDLDHRFEIQERR